MKKSFLNIILLQCVVTFFGLLHHVEGAAATCGKCPAGFKWSDCVDCKAYCPYNCKLSCTPGCVCEDDNKLMLGFKCVPKDSCRTTLAEMPICPEGALFRKRYTDCQDYCPGAMEPRLCDYSRCQWGCKCFKNGHLIDPDKRKCVHHEHCKKDYSR